MVPSASILFVSQVGITSGAVESYGVRKRVEAVKNCRRISKHDMKYNGATPKMSVDPETFVRSRFCLMPICWDVLTIL
jgi:urease